MSSPLNTQILVDLNCEQEVSKKSESLMQILDLLEVLKSNSNEKMVRISCELTEILSNEDNLNKIENAKNLNELLEILQELNLSKMLKIYDNETLKDYFPTLARCEFIK